MQFEIIVKCVCRFIRKSFTALFLLLFISTITNAQTYVNGNLSTGATASTGDAAPAGFNWSEIQTGNNNAGFAANTTAGFSVADDFTIAGGTWGLTKFTCYAYSTNYAGATSPFNEIRLQIFNTNPSVGNPTPIFGDLTTNRFTASSSASLYRIFNATPGTTRQVWKIEANISTSLPAGTYWIEWMVGTAQASNFSPASTVAGTVTQPGNNGQQHTITGNTWAPLLDGPSATDPQDMPFQLDYTTSACVGTPIPGNTNSTVTTVCPGTPFILSLQNSTSGVGVTYQWQSSSDGVTYTNIPGATLSTLTTSLSATTWYHVIITCGGNSVLSTPVQVTVNSAAIFTTQPTGVNVCVGSDAIFTTTATGVSLNYQWQRSTDGGSTWVNISGATASSLTITAVVTTMNGYKYRVILSGCGSPVTSSIAVLTVTVSPTITVQPTSLSVCAGSNAVFSVTTGVTGVTYQWQRSADGGVTWVNITGATASSLTVTTVVITMNGYKYRAILIFTSCGNINSNIASLTVLATPAGNIALPSSNNICEGSTISLIASTAISYQWYINGNSINSATSNTFNASLPGAYTVNLLNGNGCSAFANNSISLNLVRRPSVNFNVSNLCVNTSAAFANISDISNSGPVLYLWDFGDGINSTLQSPAHVFLQPGLYDVKLIVTPQLCTSLATTLLKPINILPALIGQRYQNVVAVQNFPVQLTARYFPGATYQWTPSTGLNNAVIQDPIFNNNDDQQYVVHISGSTGCSTNDTLKVVVVKKIGIYLPTAFSPNNDGQNDKLIPILIGISELHAFKVYNRWGQLLFETTSAGVGWDGVYKGIKQPVETYSWIAEGLGIDGKLISRRGGAFLIK